jgi:chromosome partitioning protein
MIIVCGGIKGGGGKTTVATNLAVMRSLAGKDVLLVDADSMDNRNASDFAALRKEKLGRSDLTAVQLQGKTLGQEMTRLGEKFDDVIVDVGGQDSINQRSALVVADVLLVPVFPSSFDVWTLENVSTLIEQARGFNDRLRAFSFLSRADSTGSQNEDASELIGEYRNLVFLDTPLRNRKAFRVASSQGLGVVELRPKDTKAISEMEALYRTVFNIKTIS